jgi:hypothetical protein
MRMMLVQENNKGEEDLAYKQGENSVGSCWKVARAMPLPFLR